MKNKKPYDGVTPEVITASAKKALAKYPKHEDTIRALRFALLAGVVPAEKGSGHYRAATAAQVAKFLGENKETAAAMLDVACKAGAVCKAAVFGFMTGYSFDGLGAPAPAPTPAEKIKNIRAEYGDI